MRLTSRPFEKAVGLAIVAVLLIIVTAIVVTSHGKKLLQKSKTVKIFIENGNGIEVGSKVTVNGLLAGSVEQVDLVVRDKVYQKDGQTHHKKADHVLVTMRIFSPYAEKVRDGSQADVQLPFIMGSTVIDIHPGPVGNAEAPDGAELSMRITKGIGGQVEDILGDIQVIASDFKSIEKELEKTMTNVEGITRRINSGNNSIGELLNDEKKMYNELLQFASDADSAAKGLNTIVTDLKASTENLPDIMADLKEMAGSLKPASKNIETASTDFEPLVKNASEAVASLEKTAEKLSTFSEDLPGIGKGVTGLVSTDLPLVLKDLQVLITQLNGVSDDLKKTTSDLPRLVDMLHATSGNADDVIRSLKGTWPISGNLPERRTPPKAIRINGRMHNLGE